MVRRALNISRKLILVYLIIAIPIFGILAYDYYSRYQARVDRVLAERTEVAKLCETSFMLSMHELGKAMKYIGQSSVENSYTAPKIEAAYRKLVNDYPVDFVVITDTKGNVTVSTDQRLAGKNLSQNEAFKSVIANYKENGISPTEVVNGNNGFYISQVIKGSDGSVRGIAGSFVDVGKLDSTLSIDFGSGGVNIVDSEGYLVFQNQYPNLATQRSYWGGYPFVKSALAGKNATSINFKFPVNGETRWISEVSIREYGWTAGSGIPVDEMIAPIRQNIASEAAATLATLLAALAIGILIVQRITRSLRRLVHSARAVGEGNFDEPIRIETGDEIEDVGRSLDDARKNLKGYVEGLAGITETGSLLASSLEIARIKETVTRSAKRLFGAEAIWIFAMNEDNGLLEPLMWTGLGDQEFSKLTIQPGHGIIGTVYQAGKPMIIQNIQAEPVVIQKELFARYGINSAVVLPLAIGEKPFGVMGLYSPDVATWKRGGRKTELFETFASQISIALENARLFDERLKVEEALSSERERLAVTLASIGDGVIATDINGTVVLFNQVAENLTGWLQKEAAGMPLLDVFNIINEETRQQAKNPVEETLKSGLIVGLANHTALIARDGSELSIADSCAPIRASDGRVLGAILVFRDITAEKLAEEALRQSEEKFRALFNNATEGIVLHTVLYDSQGNPVDYVIEDANPSFESMTGLRKADAAGRRASVFYGTGEAPYLDTYSKVVATGESASFETYFAPMEKHFSVAVFSPGPGQFATVFNDITERKAAERALSDSERQFRGIFENAASGIAHIALDGSFIMSNQRYGDIIGYSQAELARKTFLEITYYEDLDTDIGYIEELLKGVLDSYMIDERYVRKDGSLVWVNVTGSIVRDDNGMPQYFIMVVDDISERKAIERLNNELSELNTAISSTLSVDDIMQHIVVKAAAAIGVEASAIEISEGDSWPIRYAYNLEEGLLGQQLTGDKAHISLQVSEAKKPIVSSDSHNDSRFEKNIMKKNKIRSFLAIPLIVKDMVIGNLIFFNRRQPVIFSEAQIDFAGKLGTSVSLALENARLYEAERDIADTLQEAILTVPSSIDGIGYGYLYRSATEAAKVGGDFYDIFEIEEGRVGVVVGDISGKGLKASALTSLVKNTLRAYAFEGYSPATVMAKTNNTIKSVVGQSLFVTVFFGILDSHEGKLSYCSAGHPPAIVKRNGTGIELLEEHSPIIGAFANMEYVEGRAKLEKGDYLLLHTDGIIEARRKDGEFFNQDRLVSFLRDLKSKSASDLSHAVFSRVMDFTDGRLTDDVAILALCLDCDGGNNV
ncbi:MAG TPA: PAS domain S-box protein [Candidatus Aquicultor sp.]|jgi:PAS domain S-box-containing protein